MAGLNSDQINDPSDVVIDNLFSQGQTVPEKALEQEAEQDRIDRDAPEPDEARAALVHQWNDKIKQAKKYWAPVFDRMRMDQDFAFGYQWSKDHADKRYVANLVQRCISQRVAFFYAKNPEFVSKRRERILNTVWDGQQSTLVALQAAASQMMQQVAQAQMTDPMAAVQAQQQAQTAAQAAMPIMQDAQKVREEEQQLDKIAKTLELLFEYDLSTQNQDFKQMMKLVVRRACTNAVAYVKIGFERVMEKRPEVEARVADITARLGTLTRLSADIHDDEVDTNGPEVEQMRLLLADLRTQVEYVVREGLVLDYPTSTSIIPDPKTMNLKTFLGADWVVQEYVLSPNEIKEIYEVDVGKSFTAYKSDTGDKADVTTRNGFVMLENRPGTNTQRDGNDGRSAVVWEIWSRKDGLIYVMCDGYPDFLREPASPEAPTRRFWPWFVLTLNEVEHEHEIFPPSDVKILRDMQMEYNRMRQGLREHRRAARPKTVVAAGMIDEEDIEKLANHPDNAIIELNGLQPGQKVDDLLQAFRGPPVDPNLYEVEGIYTDIQRVIGLQDANMGGTSKDVTATQTNVSEASRSTAMGANIDDIDDLLTQLAKTGSEILLQECSVETVKQIVGEGAVWPDMTRQQIADQLWLEIQAGSSGRPNQAQEIANMQRMAPMLMQIPGINPEWLAKEMLRRLDDRMDLSQAFLSQLPSIMALNGMASKLAAGPQGPGGAMDFPGQGAAQAPAGASNAPRGGGMGGGAVPDHVQTGAPGAAAPGAGAPGGRPPGMPGQPGGFAH